MSQLTDVFRSLTEGLLYSSETDAPWEVTELTNANWQEQLPEPLANAQVVELDRFFANATTPQEWHEESEQQAVKRYQQLVETLKTSFDSLQILKFGEVERTIYIIGLTPQEQGVCLKTHTVET